jgi:hypothetical protein
MAFAALLSPACGGSPADDAGLARSSAGRFGALEFAIEPLSPPAAGSNAFRVAVSILDTGEPFAGGELKATAVMPSMGHESPAAPVAVEPEAGVYAVNDLVFTMPGRWEVRFRAERGDLIDEAAFAYEVR